MKNLRNRIRLSAESLEHRVMLDGGLASEFATYSSQAELKSQLIEQAVQRNQSLFDQPQEFFWWRDCLNCFGGGDVLFTNGGPEGVPVPVADATEDFSDTNTQVKGVDEGDIIETDGNYVYVLSNNELTIVDVRIPEHPRVASRVDMSDTGSAQEIYLHEDRLMVLSSDWGYYQGGGGIAIDGIAIDVEVEPFLIDSDIWWGGPTPQEQVIATVIDVENPEEPEIISRTEIDGWLNNSRAIDGAGYLVVQDNLDFPTPETKEVQMAPEEGEPVPRVYESEAEYRARIETTIMDILPDYATLDGDGAEVESGELTHFSEIYHNDDPHAWSMVSIVSIDMHEDMPSVENATTLLSTSTSEMFMSASSLYVFQPVWNESSETSIIKFDVFSEDKSVVPVAAGTVPGQMLNQFSADEHHGDLRIATTTWGERGQTSGIYVLEQDGDELPIKGKVDGLAPGEQIYSARFLGYRAYIVTFRQVDPLFAIDMTDPASPTVMGELKIPGFSNYMQPIGENHLLGFGRNADPETGRFDELQMSLFDVTDMTNPIQQDVYSFEGGRNAYSLATYDHHAFAYYPDYDTVAIPVMNWSQKEEHQSALHVISVDVESGFEFVEKIGHPSEVLRSVRVGESLISVSYDTLKVNPIEDPSELTGQLHFQTPRVGGVIPIEPTPVDIDRLFEEVETESNPARFDMDGNALVNNDDVTFLLEAVFRTDFGDTDLDGDIDFADFLQLSANFGQEGGWADGDFDGDGVVGFSDFTELANNFGG